MRLPALGIRLALGGLVVAAALGGFAMYLLQDPTERFLERRSRVAAVSAGRRERAERYVTHGARVTATSGLAVEMLVRQPPEPGERRPLIVILGGHRTGREAVELVGDPRGTIVAAISYPFTGNHRVKGLAVLGEAPAIRRAVLDTPPAVMLALDYLLTLPGVDRARVELVGVSLGAQFVPAVGALDPRVTRVWSVHGGGEPLLLLEHGLRQSVRFAPARWLAAGVAGVAIAAPRLAPERWVARIAPRPFVMVNASGDERIPRRSVHTLYAHAREPRELIWIGGGHVMPRRSEVIAQLVRIVFDRVAPAPSATFSPPPS